MNSYKINHLRLSEGIHNFQFEIDSRFFDHFKDGEIKGGHLGVRVDLMKSANLLELTIEIEGEAIVPCDRCLDNLSLQINYHDQLFVKFGEEGEVQDENLIVIPDKQADIDLARHIYESIKLSLPLKRVHQPDENGHSTCNPEMEKYYDNYIVESDEEDNTDPRWDELKDLLAN